jgi:hypothetical protein
VLENKRLFSIDKYISVLLVIFTSPLFALDSLTCYSVQLRSAPKTLSLPSTLPRECKEMTIGSYTTLRCGCYTSAKMAKTKLMHYKENYPKAILVETYKYRFIKEEEALKKSIPKKRANNQVRDWSILTTLFTNEHSFRALPSTTENKDSIQKGMKQELLKNRENKQQLLSEQSNFYGLSLQGKYEQYLNQNYRFREYTDYEYDLKLQFDIFKDGYFEHKKENAIVEKKEQIAYLQNLSNLLKNNYAEQLLILNAVTAHINYDYFSKLKKLYEEALKHRMKDYNNSLSTQSDIEELQQMLNRFKKSANIYKKHQNSTVPNDVYELLSNIEKIKLQDFKTITTYAKENNPDVQLQKARLSLLDETPSYSDEVKVNVYAHRRMVDEMGWYNTLGVEAKLPLDFSAHERKKVLELEQLSSKITQKSCESITQSKLLSLFENFTDMQQLITIDKDDISFLQRRVKRYEIIQQNTIPNLDYNPEDKILKLSQDILDLQLNIDTKKVALFKILTNIAFLSNTSDISHLIKGLQ